MAQQTVVAASVND